jgi:ABC-type dipeptide/oligopeptide/nickel transport system permease subunit
MLIVALIAAIFIYALLAFIWFSLSPQTLSVSPLIATIQNAILGVPPSLALGLLKLGIIVLAIYIVMDTMLSALRGKKREEKKRLASTERMKKLRAHPRMKMGPKPDETLWR